ncbi:MAG: sigma-54 dependent transcriptional regulator [Spirochaetota bacterium]
MRILILDDDATLRAELATFLSLNGHEPVLAANLAEARQILARDPSWRPGSGRDPAPAVDLVLADLYLGAERGSEILPVAGKIPIVMISGAGGVREAVDALKGGAWDFLEKPVDPDRLLGIIRNLSRNLAAERGIEALRQAWLAEHAAFSPGSPFEAALDEARRVGASPLSILVTGPSGCGKEIIARWAHYGSSRSGEAFVSVNCAAISPELADAAFFGARRGAYTGADTDRPGWFQAANGGTLFLDEIGEIPLATQAKLLRAVESGEVQRVGSTEPERVSLRIVSATNRDLAAEVRVGRFREDLLWRLAQAIIRVPALSGRRMDIAPLAAFFLERSRGSRSGVPGIALSSDAMAWLESRSWPGNARELRALIERAAWLVEDHSIDAAFLARLSGDDNATSSLNAGLDRNIPIRQADSADSLLPLREARENFEQDHVRRALEAASGSVTGAAAILGMLPNNLSRKMRELGLGRPGRERR